MICIVLHLLTQTVERRYHKYTIATGKNTAKHPYRKYERRTGLVRKAGCSEELRESWAGQVVTEDMIPGPLGANEGSG